MLAQHVASVAQVPVGVPPLPELEPLPEPPLLELDAHSVWQFWLWHWMRACTGVWQLDSWAFALHDCARLAL